MFKADVIRYFEKPVHVARILGISRAAIAKWPEIIPKAAAYDLARLTKGALTFRPELYEARHRGSVARTA